MDVRAPAENAAGAVESSELGKARRALMVETSASPCELSDAKARIVLLGASNLTLSLPLILELAPQILGHRQFEIFAALGHGRSYGQTSRVFFRALPSILECGLWRALAARPALPTYALVSDVGNDLAYGVDPATIGSWLRECLARLQPRAQLVVSALPVASLERLRPWQIRLARTLLFPWSEVTPQAIQQGISALNLRLRELAAEHGAQWVEQPGWWYGLDPIHIRRSARRQACSALLAGWRRTSNERCADDFAPTLPRASFDSWQKQLWRAWRCRFTVPEQRWICGLAQLGSQPTWSAPSFRLWLY